jgi:hypothetical protein
MASAFDAVIIPGGMAPDKMRRNPNTVGFVQDAMQQGKLVAAVCHGPQVLIEGDLLRGKQATGFIAIRKDMINAGANYIDEPLVIDGNLITSRQPEFISWASAEGADVDNSGFVRFTKAPSDRGTEVKVVMEYNPPGGALGAAIAKLFGEEPEQQIGDELRRFKMLMEAGEIATTEGQPKGNG